MKFLNFYASILATTAIASAQWQNLTPNVPGTLADNDIGPMLASGSELYVLGDKGIFRTTNGGTTFVALNTVTGASYDLGRKDLLCVEKAGSYIYVGATPGNDHFTVDFRAIHRMQAGDMSWVRAAQSELPDTVFADTASDFTYDPVSGKYFAASNFAGCYSSDDGLVWNEKRTGLPTTNDSVFGIFTRGESVLFKSGKVFLSTLNPTGNSLVGDSIYSSADSAESWSSSGVPQGSTGEMAQLGNRLMIATGTNNGPTAGTYVSDDNGGTLVAQTVSRRSS